MGGGPIGPFLQGRLAFGLAQGLGQLTGVDVHRAADLAQAVGGAGLLALVTVVVWQGASGAGCWRPDDAGATFRAGRQCAGAGSGSGSWRADRLAESALDAFVDQGMGGRQGF